MQNVGENAVKLAQRSAALSDPGAILADGGHDVLPNRSAAVSIEAGEALYAWVERKDKLSSLVVTESA